jgi:hypothetical protein
MRDAENCSNNLTRSGASDGCRGSNHRGDNSRGGSRCSPIHARKRSASTGGAKLARDREFHQANA